jgi:hypothetical protein
MIIQGNNNINAIHRNNTPLSAVYKGGSKIWPVTPPVIDGRVLFHKVFNSMNDLTATVGSSVGTWMLHNSATGNADGTTGIVISPAWNSNQIPYYELANAVDIVYPLYIKGKGYFVGSGYGHSRMFQVDEGLMNGDYNTMIAFLVDISTPNNWKIEVRRERKFTDGSYPGGYDEETFLSATDRGNQFTTDGSIVEILIEADGHITARIDGAVIINDQITHLEYLINKVKVVSLGRLSQCWDTANWVCQEMTVIDGYEPSLYAWYPFAGDILDHSGHERHLTGTAQFVEDPEKGTVLECGNYWGGGNPNNNWGNYLRTPFPLDSSWTNFKIKFKVWVAGEQVGYGDVFETGGNYGTSGIKLENYLYNDRWTFVYKHSNSEYKITGIDLLTDVWNDIEIGVHPGGVYVICNGVRTDAAFDGSLLTDGFENYPIRIGSGSSYRYFAGKLKDFKIYKL